MVEISLYDGRGDGPPVSKIAITRVIHRGARNQIFEGVQDGQPVAVKIPRLIEDGVVADSIHFGSELFSWASTDADGVLHLKGQLWSQFQVPTGLTRLDLVESVLLRSELETLRVAGPHWNASVIGQYEWHPSTLDADGIEARDLSSSCLVMPFFEGDTLSSLPLPEQRALWLALLPPLWTALDARSHGDVHPDNILLAPDRSLFRLIDPASACVWHGRQPSRSYFTRTWFVTRPDNYPLYMPFELYDQQGYLVTEKMRIGFENLLDAGDVIIKERNAGRREQIYSHITDLREQTLSASSPSDTGARIHPAEQMALGLITYRLFAERELLVPDLIPEAAWIGHHGHGSSRDYDKKLAVALKAFDTGYLREALESLAPAGLRSLIEKLVKLKITDRADLETTLGRV